MKNLYLGIAAFLLLSCAKEQNIETGNTESLTVKVDSTTLPKVPQETQSDELQTFGFPAEVEGCSCYFSKSKEDFDNEKYVYIDDYDKYAFIKMEDKEIKIPMKNEDFDPKNFSKKISNSDLSIHIEGKKVEELEEVMMFEGTMTVTLNSGEKFTTPIYGECGC